MSLLMIFPGCREEQVTGSFKVSGVLISEGIRVKNATVDIDGLLQYTAVTDAEGFFIIENVPAGRHALNMKKGGTDDSFIQKSIDIDLHNSDLYFNSLVLPNPVMIDGISLDSLTNRVTIRWNRSTAEDFREYKLYSHATSGLDETTGHLEHVTIDRNDTVKTLQLENLVQRFYRVFVMNEYGKLGGSNVVNISSVNKNIIPGGDFDHPGDLDPWTLTGNILIDPLNAYAGSGSLLLASVLDTVNNNLSGTIDRWPVSENKMHVTLALEKDRDYTLSFWYRLSGFGYMMYPFNFYYFQNNGQKIYTTVYDYNWAGTWIPLSPFKILDDTGWLYFSKTFTSDSESNAVFHITGQVENIWIDRLEIRITE